MITVNRPFPDLAPLHDYLGSLEEVTLAPSEAAVDELMRADTALTDKAVLFPEQEFVHDEGYRTFGFKPCTVSDWVEIHGRMALHDQGILGYEEESRRHFSQGTERTDLGTPENRQNAARVALISLGGKLAVSGAFIRHQIQPAYEAITETMDRVGHGDEAFTQFGKFRISRDLADEYRRTRNPRTPQHPIAATEARGNIEEAWKVVGRPYGKMTKVVLALS